MNMAKLAKPLPALALLVALGVVAATAAPVVWHWRGEFATGPVAQTAAPIANVTEPLATVDIGPILALAPFGLPPEAVIADLPLGETVLNLTLLGVVVRSDPTRSRALIATPDLSGHYGPGDRIADQAVLVDVAQDHVILDVDGAYQILSFPTPGDGLASVAPTLSGTDRLLAAVTAQQPDPTPEAAPQTPADYIDLWRDASGPTPARCCLQLGLSPRRTGMLLQSSTIVACNWPVCAPAIWSGRSTVRQSAMSSGTASCMTRLRPRARRGSKSKGTGEPS